MSKKPCITTISYSTTPVKVDRKTTVNTNFTFSVNCWDNDDEVISDTIAIVHDTLMECHRTLTTRLKSGGVHIDINPPGIMVKVPNNASDDGAVVYAEDIKYVFEDKHGIRAFRDELVSTIKSDMLPERQILDHRDIVVVPAIIRTIADSFYELSRDNIDLSWDEIKDFTRAKLSELGYKCDDADVVNLSRDIVRVALTAELIAPKSGNPAVVV